jgi:hypothetical protein
MGAGKAARSAMLSESGLSGCRDGLSCCKISAMTTVDEILTAIENLSFDERVELARRMGDREDDEWDLQMMADAKAGKLDKLIAETEDDIKAGRARKLP